MVWGSCNKSGMTILPLDNPVGLIQYCTFKKREGERGATDLYGVQIPEVTRGVWWSLLDKLAAVKG